MKCVILSARAYSFKDDGGNQRDGVTVNYLDGHQESDRDRRGVFPLSISGPVGLWERLAALPGVYECDFKQRPGKNNRPSLQLVDVTFVTPVRLDTLTEAEA